MTAKLSPNAALSASAAVLAGLLVVQAGRNADNPAHAEMASTVGGFVLMTTEGQNAELMYVIDNLNENLLVYDVAQQRSIELLRKESLPDMFKAARAATGR